MESTIALRPAWVEINAGAIEHNTRQLVARLGGAGLIAMVKANAYGHGAVPAGRAAVRGGAAWLGVYSAGEGIELRDAGITAPILVVGPTLPAWMRPALERDLTLTLPAADYFQPLLDAAAGLDHPIPVHIKLDTGMTRLGLDADTAAREIAAFARNPQVNVQGIMTHLAVADDPDARGTPNWGREFTQRQLDLFSAVVGEVEAAGVPVRYRHATNSPGSLYFQRPEFNLARSGILLYGLHPSAETPRPDGFQPALTFKTSLAQIRRVPAGRFISYGSTFETTRPTTVGVLMVGYADGFRRGPHNYHEVLVHGKRVPILGRVCMDQTMVDLTDLPGARVGDQVVLIGKQGTEEITAEEVGAQLGTNNYEAVTTISARVPRIVI